MKVMLHHRQKGVFLLCDRRDGEPVALAGGLNPLRGGGCRKPPFFLNYFRFLSSKEQNILILEIYLKF